MHALIQEAENYMLPCLAKKTFGIDCPGCGVQRSLVHVTKGEFTEAFHMYPAIFTIILMIVFFLINKRFKFTNGSKIMLTLAIINVTIVVVSYIYKMNTIFQLI